VKIKFYPICCSRCKALLAYARRGSTALCSVCKTVNKPDGKSIIINTKGTKNMKNVEMSVKENVLVIKIDLGKDLGPSKSGKTNIVATTGGNVQVPEYDDYRVGINCYKFVKN
jgi:LSD1 subclass zinc finger protein